MSCWGGLEAEFYVDDDRARRMLSGRIEEELEKRDPTAPTGSESGPTVDLLDQKVWVHGRLRDVLDHEYSPLVLAWFVRCAGFSHAAFLVWELDSGPRYRYKWDGRTLIKEKGVLDA